MRRSDAFMWIQIPPTSTMSSLHDMKYYAARLNVHLTGPVTQRSFLSPELKRNQLKPIRTFWKIGKFLNSFWFELWLFAVLWFSSITKDDTEESQALRDSALSAYLSMVVDKFQNSSYYCGRIDKTDVMELSAATSAGCNHWLRRG